MGGVGRERTCWRGEAEIVAVFGSFFLRASMMVEKRDMMMFGCSKNQTTRRPDDAPSFIHSLHFILLSF